MKAEGGHEKKMLSGDEVEKKGSTPKTLEWLLSARAALQSHSAQAIAKERKSSKRSKRKRQGGRGRASKQASKQEPGVTDREKEKALKRERLGH